MELERARHRKSLGQFRLELGLKLGLGEFGLRIVRIGVEVGENYSWVRAKVWMIGVGKIRFGRQQRVHFYTCSMSFGELSKSKVNHTVLDSGFLMSKVKPVVGILFD